MAVLAGHDAGSGANGFLRSWRSEAFARSVAMGSNPFAGISAQRSAGEAYSYPAARAGK